MSAIDSIIAVTNLMDIEQAFQTHNFDTDDAGLTHCVGSHNGPERTMGIDRATQSFYCKNPDCRLHGNAIDLVCHVEQTGIWEAVHMVAEDIGLDAEDFNGSRLTSEEAAGLACLRFAARYYAKHIDLAVDYLEGRGISRDTAERYLIGASPGKEGLKTSLQQNGFSKKTIEASRLLNDFEEDFFQNRVVIPIRINGMVVDFYGRALDDDNPVQQLRMNSQRSVKVSVPFNWDSRRKEIIVVEGPIDALSLIDKGYENTVAVFGTKGLASELYLELLKQSSVRTIYLCYDGDKAGAKATKKDGRILEELGYEVKVIDIDDMDPNESILAHGAEEFEERLKDALSPIQWEIENLDENLSPEEKIKELEGVMIRCKKMKPLLQAATVERLADALGFSKKAVREHIAELPDTDEDYELLDLSNCQSIHPALDVLDEKIVISVPQGIMDPDTGSMEWIPFLVTSDKEFFPAKPLALHKRGLYTTARIMADEPRYSMEAVKSFLQGDSQGDLIDAFLDINLLLTEYVDFADRNTYVFLTAWIIGTYLYPMFNYYPYIHFTGTKNVGKSKTMKLMSCICFNGTMSVSITPASQFRIIEAFRPTLLMDETEDLKEKAASDRRAVLLGGYEAGSSVIRTEKDKDNYKAKRMGNYGPRAFASIEGLEDTLASRTIQITMKRSYDEAIKQQEVNLRDTRFQDIRDKLFMTAMTDGLRIKRIYESIKRPDSIEFGDREYNLIKPLLAICEATGRNEIVESLITFANEGYHRKVAEYNNSAPENVLLLYLLELVEKDDWYRSNELHAGFVKYIKDNGLDLNMSISKSYMGGLVKKLGIVSDSRRSADRTCTLYYIKLYELSKVAANYQVI